MVATTLDYPNHWLDSAYYLVSNWNKIRGREIQLRCRLAEVDKVFSYSYLGDYIFYSIFGNDKLLFNNFIEIETMIGKLQNNFLEHFDHKIMTMHYWSEKIVNAKRVNKKQKSENIKFNLKDIEINYKNFKKKESKIKRYNTFLRKIHNKVLNFQIKIS